jgi:hypothetical protein
LHHHQGDSFQRQQLLYLASVMTAAHAPLLLRETSGGSWVAAPPLAQRPAGSDMDIHAHFNHGFGGDHRLGASMRRYISLLYLSSPSPDSPPLSLLGSAAAGARVDFELCRPILGSTATASSLLWLHAQNA